MMKRIVYFLLSVTLCASLTVSSFATEAFTPSVSSKDAPDIIAEQNEEGQTIVAVIRQESGDDVAFVELGDLVVTSVMDAQNAQDHATQAEKVLVEVYEALSDGSMKIPYEKLGEVDADKMVVRDLFEVSFAEDSSAQNYTAVTRPEGVFLEITFRLGIPAGVRVYAMTYNDGRWETIRETRNNGDGTVTCLFEHLCPVAFCVEEAVPEMPADIAADPGRNETASEHGGSGVAVWTGMAAVSAALLAAAAAIRKQRGNQK